MSKALSIDLRSRVLAAIAAGSSCRQAGARFGVSASSAIRWRALEREHGDARPKALGGDRRSGRIEAQAALIFSLLKETPDFTLEELRAALAEKGVAVGYGTLWRFFKRRQITRESASRKFNNTLRNRLETSSSLRGRDSAPPLPHEGLAGAFGDERAVLLVGAVVHLDDTGVRA
jgi:transposase